MSFRALILLGFLTAGTRSLLSQQFTARVDNGAVIMLADGRWAVLRQEGGAVFVKGVVRGEGNNGPFLDVVPGDRVAGFQEQANPTLDRITARWGALPAGAEVLLTLARGNAAPHKVRFARPAPSPGDSARTVTFQGRPDVGSWVSAGSPGTVPEMSIAGARIRNNKDGMPEVMSRGSHPAASTVALHTGDVITAVNGKAIAALAGLEKSYQALGSGDEVTLTVTRAGQAKAITFRKPSE